MDFMGLFAIVPLFLTFLIVEDKGLVFIGPLTLFILSGVISQAFSLRNFASFLAVALFSFLIIFNFGNKIFKAKSREDFYIKNLESAAREREEIFEKIKTFEKKAEMEEEPSVREYMYKNKRDMEGSLKSLDREIQNVIAEIRRRWE